MRREYIFSRENFHKLKALLGPRPGGYRLDPDYLRTGMGDKPYFWNSETKKWEGLRLGDVLVIEDDGSVTRIPVASERKVS